MYGANVSNSQDSTHFILMVSHHQYEVCVLYTPGIAQKHQTGLLNDKHSKCRVHMQNHRTAKCVACHNWNLPQSFHQCMQKPKERIILQLTVCRHSKAIENITTWKSHMCSLFGVLSQSLESSDWFTGFAIWSFAEVRHLRCLMPALQISGLVWLYKQYHMQYLLHWTPATVHRLIPWISWPRCRDSPTASGPVVFLVKTSITFSTLTSSLFIRVLSLPLWAFLICFCCKTHKHNRWVIATH